MQTNPKEEQPEVHSQQQQEPKIKAKEIKEVSSGGSNEEFAESQEENKDDQEEDQEKNQEEDKEEDKEHNQEEDKEDNQEEEKEDDQEEDKEDDQEGDKEEVSSKKYTKQENFIMLSLALHYPTGGHGGEAFWRSMTKIYGDTLLEGRNSSGLRNHWRIMLKQYASMLKENKQKLEESLPKEFVEDVEKKIAEAAANAANFELSNKAYKSLFPELPKPDTAKGTERALKKKKMEDGSAQAIPIEESKKVRKTKDLPHKGKNHIDLTQLISKKPVRIVSLAMDNVLESQTKMALCRNIVIIKDIKENDIKVKDIKELPSVQEIQGCKKLDSNLHDFFKSWNKAIAESNKKKGEWNELEDIVLKYPGNSDLMNLLVKTRGADEVLKRKRALNLP